MPKQGNSNTEERIRLITRFIQLFGKESIDCLVADREFIGAEWINYLNLNRIEYYIRAREIFWTVNSKTGKRLKASWEMGGFKNHTFYSMKEVEEALYNATTSLLTDKNIVFLL